MSNLTPILASEASAAKLLDLPVDVFRGLVMDGHLPKGREIAPGVTRWDTEQLRKIGRGEAVDGMGDVEW